MRPAAVVLAFLIVVSTASNLFADVPVTILHSFGPGEGGFPDAGLTLSGSTLYGTTSNGGSMFSIGTDGLGFNTLHSFPTGSNDGQLPNASLTLVDSTLYGTTTFGGSSNLNGTVFSFNTTTSAYQIVHNFTDAFSDGGGPYAGLTLLGSKLYGTTNSGGTSGGGAIYSINSDGSGYNLAASMGAGSNSGVFPKAALTAVGSKLFGTTGQGGGPSSVGTIYSFDPSTNSITYLHSFLSNDGAFPDSDLTLNGTTLYGTASSGGAFNRGTIFSYDTATTAFNVLYSFGGIPNDGQTPDAGLTLVGSTLYGTTDAGGSLATGGTIFSINTDGSGYQIVHNFAGAFTDGGSPQADLLLVGSTVYGTTLSGGGSGGGTIFALAVPEPASWSLSLLGIGSLVLLMCCRRN